MYQQSLPKQLLFLPFLHPSLQGVPSARRPGLSWIWFGCSIILPSCLAASAKFPLAQSESGRQWSTQNPSQPNPVHEQMGHSIFLGVYPINSDDCQNGWTRTPTIKRSDEIATHYFYHRDRERRGRAVRDSRGGSHLIPRMNSVDECDYCTIGIWGHRPNVQRFSWLWKLGYSLTVILADFCHFPVQQSRNMTDSIMLRNGPELRWRWKGNAPREKKSMAAIEIGPNGALNRRDGRTTRAEKSVALRHRICAPQ